MSAAAISQHIRKFEDYVGKDVFTRLNNRVVLTDAGRTLFERTADALPAISEATTQMRTDRGTRGRMGISCIDSLAETWMLPVLTTFCNSREGFRFDLRIEPDPVDLGRGEGIWPRAPDPAVIGGSPKVRSTVSDAFPVSK